MLIIIKDRDLSSFYYTEISTHGNIEKYQLLMSSTAKERVTSVGWITTLSNRKSPWTRTEMKFQGVIQLLNKLYCNGTMPIKLVFTCCDLTSLTPTPVPVWSYNWATIAIMIYSKGCYSPWQLSFGTSRNTWRECCVTSWKTSAKEAGWKVISLIPTTVRVSSFLVSAHFHD